MLVKVVGGGIGIGREAYKARKERKAQEATSLSESTSPGIGSRSLPDSSLNDHRGLIAELPTTEAEKLIATGQAIPLEPDPVDSHDRDEYDWQLDDAVELAGGDDRLERVSSGKKKDQFIQAIRRLPPPNLSTSLALPVIVPQRRPRKKERGFVRAYAPVLQDVGIDQDAFLLFLETFDESAKASPILDVVFIAASIVGLVPLATAQITSAVVSVAVGAAKEIQSRHRTNTFLDTVNEKLFKPRGLFCMVMAFKSDTDSNIPFVSSGQINITDTIAKCVDNSGSRVKDGMRSLRGKSGTTRGELELPAAAPLVFPALDRVVDGEGKEKSGYKKFGEFVNDYMDRRAQASFHGANPESSLQVPKPEFRSRYADPNHPTNGGDIAAFLTGGKINLNEMRGRGSGRGGLLGTRGYSEQGLRGGGLPGLLGSQIGRFSSPSGYEGQYRGLQRSRPSLGDRHYEAYGDRSDRRLECRDRLFSSHNDHPGPSLRYEQGRGMGRRGSGRNAGPIGLVRRVMQKDVLYLIVVNMPSDKEIAEARARLASGRI